MKPRIGITMGDPAGVGPEIILKALQEYPRSYTPVVFGNKKIFIKTAKCLNLPAPDLCIVATPLEDGQIKFPIKNASTVYFRDFPELNDMDIAFGELRAENGFASGRYIQEAYKAIKDGFIDALVTAPINKEAFSLGGWGKKYPGHTEMLANLSGAKNVALMLAKDNFRVVHVTQHIPLRKVASEISPKRIFNVIELAHSFFYRLLKRQPILGICGLNPHAGDGGVLGQEEKTLIKPAIIRAVKLGFRVVGPFPADSLFPKMLKKEIDVVIAMYHDQGQIPFKMLTMSKENGAWTAKGTNVTLGLPFIRTSPAHGTAFDIAGKNQASPYGILDAIRTATQMFSE